MTQIVRSNAAGSTFDTAKARWTLRDLLLTRPEGFPARWWPSQATLRATVNEMLTSDSRHQGYCYASARTLGTFVQKTERTMRWVLKALCELGVLERVGFHPEYATRVYRFCVGWIDKRHRKRKRVEASSSAAWSWSSSTPSAPPASSSSSPASTPPASSAELVTVRTLYMEELGRAHQTQHAIEPAPLAWDVAAELGRSIAKDTGEPFELACRAMWREYMRGDGWDDKLRAQRHPAAWLRSHAVWVAPEAVKALRNRRQRTASAPQSVAPGCDASRIRGFIAAAGFRV